MSVEWNNLPLLPLKCIFDHLSIKEALTAMATCRQWRQTLLLYEGRRETLKLDAKELNKSLFLAKLFKKNATKLHISIDCTEDLVNKFMNYVLPLFFESVNLKEVVFIGPKYVRKLPAGSFTKLKRMATESLVFKNSRTLQKLAFMGCEISSVKYHKDRMAHKQVEYYSKPLSYTGVTTSADSVLSRCNVEAMMRSSLKHILLEFDLITMETLETFSHLSNLKVLSMNVAHRFHSDNRAQHVITWSEINEKFNSRLEVAVNITYLKDYDFPEVIKWVFVLGLPLTSLKVMFCKTIHLQLINHVAYYYTSTLREVLWVDVPYDDGIRPPTKNLGVEVISDEFDEVNPFVLLCWQCPKIRRLVVHGYWVWQYDILGFVRLRRALVLEVSSMYAKQRRGGPRGSPEEFVWRVMVHDKPPCVDKNYIQRVNNICDHNWQPIPWTSLHPGLRANCSKDSQVDYIVEEALQPLGIT